MLSQCPALPLTASTCGLCVWELFGDCSLPLELVSVAFLLSWLQFTFIPSWWWVKWTIRLTNYRPTPRGVVGYVWLNLWFPVTALSKAFGTYWSPKHALTLKWPNTLKIREYMADVYTVGVEETEPPARQDYKKKNMHTLYRNHPKYKSMQCSTLWRSKLHNICLWPLLYKWSGI